MRRHELEHVLRASAGVTDEVDFVVLGSQAILGSFPQPPAELVTSVEADVYPREQPERAILIDGAIGEGSIFHETFGYYAHGVGPDTAIAPEGWLDRLVPLTNVNTRGAVGWCMEPHDLVIAKLVAARDKDLDFARAAVEHGLVQQVLLLERASLLPAEETRDRVRALIASLPS